MALEPIGGYTSPPSIESFSKPSLDSLEMDLKRAEQKRAQNKYYRESISSYRDLPRMLPEKAAAGISSKDTVDQLTKNAATEGSSSVWNKITSFFDSAYTYFWGSPLDETPGSPISGTPKLTPPNQLGYSQASMERLAKLMDDMNKDLERIQEVVKEENLQSTSSEEAMALFMHLAILKRQSELKKEEAVAHSESIQVLHEATRKEHGQRKDLQTHLESAENSAWWAGNVATGSKAALGLIGMLQVAELLGYATLNPAVALASRIASIALMGTTGASTLVKTNFDKKKIEHQGELQTIRHKRDMRSVQIRDHGADIKHAHQSASSVLNDGAIIIKNSNRVKEALARF